MSQLKGKVALITGASRGLGAQIALRYAQEGAELLLLARGTEELEKVDDLVRKLGGQAVLIPFDLDHWSGVDQLANPLYQQYGRLDILVGNAAQLGTLGPIAQANPEEVERLFHVNVMANWRLLRVCDPLLRLAPHGRVLFVTCGTSSAPVAYWGLKAMTKAALEALVLTYAQEVAQTKIHVNLIRPAAMRTTMRQEAMPGENPAKVPPPECFTESFVELAREDCQIHGKIIPAKIQGWPLLA